MNVFLVLILYLAGVGAALYILTITFQKSGFSLGQKIGLKRGIRGIDWHGYPIRSALKVFLAFILHLFYWSALGSGGMIGGEMIPIADPIASFFIACGLTDIFVYGSKLLSAVGFLAIYLGFYFFEFGATTDFRKTLITLIILALAVFVIFARKRH